MVPWVVIPVCLICGAILGVFYIALCTASSKGGGDDR